MTTLHNTILHMHPLFLFQYHYIYFWPGTEAEGDGTTDAWRDVQHGIALNVASSPLVVCPFCRRETAQAHLPGMSMST